MFRFRRYRVFLAFAIIAIGLLYHFTSLGDLESAGAASVEGLKNFGSKIESSTGRSKDTSANAGNDRFNAQVAAPSLVDSGPVKPTSGVKEAPKGKPSPPLPKDKESSKEIKAPDTTGLPPPINGGSRAAAKPSPDIAISKAAPSDHPYLGKPIATDNATVAQASPVEPITGNESSKGRLELGPDERTVPKIHWSQLPEHFPVPTDKLIQLPTGKPETIPKIQHVFSDQGSGNTLVQQDKLDVIKKAFSFSWAGYRQKAWMQDELSPLSGKYRNGFCGWGATLVDSLDTLWMMNLKDEFEEVVEAVKDIDFTTSMRNDIPLFETVIRYLGGLVAAYDISGATHRILLDKAVELADILMGAFDTPNRMPMTFYLWKPTFASQPHRAKTRVVLAELGSLSLEFTRLAQITKEAKYYDAIARITNEFEIWQGNTNLPGLWPLKVDASGCKKPDAGSSTHDHSTLNDSKNNRPLTLPEKAAANRAAASNPEIMDDSSAMKSDLELDHALVDDSEHKKKPPEPELPDDFASTADANANANVPNKDPSTPPPQGGSMKKREVAIVPPPRADPDEIAKRPDCEPQGLASPPYSGTEEFTLGGQADSTYEYLPKEYMLLGGLEDKYRKMYEMAADATTKHLLYRPMIPDEKRSILQAGLLKRTGKEKPGQKPDFTAEGAHLTCFIGGMFAVGAKIFDRREDLDIAKKLTDGCVWAYEATTTGIMPETYLSISCDKTESCPWNVTLWHEKLDPFGSQREHNRLKQQNQHVLSDDRTAVTPKEKVDTAEKAENANTADRAKPAGENMITDSSQIINKQAIKADADLAAESAHLAKGMSTVNDATSGSSAGSEGKSLESSFKGSGDTIEKSFAKPAQLESARSDIQSSSGAGPSKSPQADTDVVDRRSSMGAGPPKGPLQKRQPDDAERTPSGARPKSMDNEKSVKESLVKASSDQSDSPVDTMKNSAAMASKPKANSTQSDSQLTTPEIKTNSTAYSQSSIPTREDYIAARIKDERLPLGMTRVTAGRYLLRPEAIESVFIMYRVTGDNYWREKGWKMFQAIEKHTLATFGASAISDVTAEKPKILDEMESFWLAETLKYFYLLYSDPAVVSLDDYVLNTEAHPFKRPG